MLDKKTIIKELKNDNYLVREDIYRYICNFHLYDDKDINLALIEFLKANYKEINFVGLVYSKLNKEIIECLIDLQLSEKD